MKITLESTSEIVSVDGVNSRVWEGETAGGIKCYALIQRIAVKRTEDAREFEKDLLETPHPRLSEAGKAFVSDLRGFMP